MARGPEALRRWEEFTYWPLIVASFLWLVAYSWKSIADAQGLLCRESVPDPSAFERANYMKVLHSWG